MLRWKMAVCDSMSRHDSACPRYTSPLMKNETTQTAGDSSDSSVAKSTTLKLLGYCQRNEWAGYDPYDALNCEIFESWPILDARIPRLVLTQALKRSPIDIRPWLRVPPTQNAKALALFLDSLLKLSRLGLLEDDKLIQNMCERLGAYARPTLRTGAGVTAFRGKHAPRSFRARRQISFAPPSSRTLC